MKVFIDGREGTTGLQIEQRLTGRADIELIAIDPALRKDAGARRACLAAADLAFLCLPDDAAREAVALAQGLPVKILDASTAHRTAPGWAYGFPELSPAHRAALAAADRVAVPGCHASGFAALVYPLRAAGLLPAGAGLICHSVTGYSGGGKKMIAAYEGPAPDISLKSPRQYGLTQGHKHLPEMKAVCGLNKAPLFSPIVADFYSGMAVTLPLHADSLENKASVADLYRLYAAHYAGSPLIRVLAPDDPTLADGFLPANALSGRDDMEIIVTGSDERILLAARFDNLGKGAAGAAIQCMNIMMNLPEGTNLVVPQVISQKS